MKKTTKKPGMPFADSAIAKYIDKKIDELKGVKTQREIAAEIDYDKPNMISMFKRGEARVPLDKIPLLAKALGVDPAHMFRTRPRTILAGSGRHHREIVRSTRIRERGGDFSEALANGDPQR